jgi:uncharacterized protein YcfJ
VGRAAGGWAQLRRAAALLLPLALLACSGTKRPVLYPNALYQEVGEAAAREDVNHCIEVARAHDLSDDRTAGDAARGATRGSLIGAAVGAAVGWVLGNPGRGAAAGAAGGGTRGAVKGATHSGDADNVYRRFVETCLREIGYQPIGWR